MVSLWLTTVKKRESLDSTPAMYSASCPLMSASSAPKIVPAKLCEGEGGEGGGWRGEWAGGSG